LISTVPEAVPMVEEQLTYLGKVHLLLLLKDVACFVREAYDAGDAALVDRCLTYLDTSLRTGDEEVQNAIRVAFVENTALWEPGTKEWMATWPDSLRDDDRYYR
jgi:hypothetical protein